MKIHDTIEQILLQLKVIIEKTITITTDYGDDLEILKQTIGDIILKII